MIHQEIADMLAQGGDIVLMPGNYLVELEFERPVQAPLLLRVLSGMGWSEVTIDQSADRVSTGAALAPLGAKLAKPVISAVTKASAVKSALTREQPRAVIVKAAAPTTVKVTSPDTKKPSPAPISRNPVQAPARAINTVSFKPSATARAVVTAKPVSPVAKPGPIARPGVTARPSPGRPATPAPEPVEESQPSPSQEPSYEPSYESDGTYSPPVEETYATAPPEEEAVALPSISDLWQRWKEWGSPFAGEPSVRTSGVEDDAVRFRFVGHLDAPLRLTNQPGLTRWLYVQPINVEPFDMLRLQLVPYPLEHGKTYEMKFLSRMRSQPTRRAVCEGLMAMGFRPLKLAALKKNMRMPGRSGASVTLWYGVGRWEKPDSVVVADDPFYFEDLKELAQ